MSNSNATSDQFTTKIQYLSIDQLRQKLGGRSLSSINRDELDGNFPKSVKLGRIRYWRESDVDAHMDALFEARHTVQ
jgi:predicted DNA-binding transcriptional regulator AlpA